jgi:uncharacterized protein YcaQ
MTPPAFSREAVAALFIARQQLDRPRGRRLTAASLTRFVESVGGLQLDSINVLERAHYLTVWSRFGPYDRATLDRLAYEKRVLHEYWAHAACLIPATHLHAWRRAMLDYRPRHTGWTSWLRKHRRLLGEVEGAIRERGPLSNADFMRPKSGPSAGWWSWKPATHALHLLWMNGRLLIHSRRHFQKRYDLAERVVPDIGALETPGSEEFLRWHFERSLHAMGAATELDLRMYLTFPRLEAAVRRRAFRAMVDRGEVVEVAVEGHRAKWFARASDLPELARAERVRVPSRGTTLLAPFDSFLWHRQRTAQLFGFDYRIEVYTPGHRRVHGYYTLPLFHDGQLIGRVDAKNHREERRLEARHVHFEDWLARDGAPPAASWGRIDRDRALAGLAETLRSLAVFTGATRVEVARVTPRRLASAVRSALRHAETGATSTRLPAASDGA